MSWTDVNIEHRGSIRRCRNCEHYLPNKEGCYISDEHADGDSGYAYPDDFCSRNSDFKLRKDIADLIASEVMVGKISMFGVLREGFKDQYDSDAKIIKLIGDFMDERYEADNSKYISK